MLITVFTPTYNRAHLLPRLYESLCHQTCTDFEWLIVDDGSTDGTESLIQNFELRIKNSVQCGNEATPALSQLGRGQNGILRFSGVGGIRYIRQPNGGKHRAINRGVREARGELFFIVDSDDYLLENSLEVVAAKFEKIINNKRIGGVCGLDMAPDQSLVSSGFPQEEIICNCLDIRLKHRVTGDLKEVFRTDVLREFPFPEIEDERFCPEALVWNRIAQKYNLLFFNEPIYIAEYQPEGITAGIVRARMNSPVASATTYQELNSYNIPIKEKIKAAINYWRFRACVAKGKQVPILPWYWFWCRPLGLAMHMRDKL
ncbi:MAG: glycosyltransferase family 2 protein [Muribaculaceae bacterium]|nr:glycosyltransferase family 2 protein [Muribaculaceae bacterium]